MAQAMEKSKVIELLEYYKDIDGEVSIYRKIITDLTDQYYNPIGAIQCDGLPKGKNNISRQTENMALNIPDYVSGEIREYEEKVQQLQNLKAQMLQEISRLIIPQLTEVLLTFRDLQNLARKVCLQLCATVPML